MPVTSIENLEEQLHSLNKKKEERRALKKYLLFVTSYFFGSLGISLPGIYTLLKPRSACYVQNQNFICEPPTRTKHQCQDAVNPEVQWFNKQQFHSSPGFSRITESRNFPP